MKSKRQQKISATIPDLTVTDPGYDAVKDEPFEINSTGDAADDNIKTELDCPEIVIFRYEDNADLFPEDGTEYYNEASPQSASKMEEEESNEDSILENLKEEKYEIIYLENQNDKNCARSSTAQYETETENDDSDLDETLDAPPTTQGNPNSSSKITKKKTKTKEPKDKSDQPIPQYDATGKRIFVCDICGRSFTKVSNFKAHALVHNNLRQFQCCHCGQSYKTMRTLRHHERTHSETPRCLCTICGREFATTEIMLEHKKRHIGQYKCEFCGRTFNQSFTMKRHRKTHTGERPFQCLECKATFIEKATFVTHQRKHSGERPFECSVCYKRFHCKSHLNEHMRTHAEERPQKCDLCSRCFVRKTDLVRHRTRVHKEHYAVALKNVEKGNLEMKSKIINDSGDLDVPDKSVSETEVFETPIEVQELISDDILIEDCL